MSERRDAKNRNRIEEIHDYGLDTENFIIYLQGVEDSFTDPDDVIEPGVEFRMANKFIKNLDVLSGIDGDRPITISMKTCGGSWEEGMAIYDAIIGTPNPISIINYTHARSMSSIIFSAANKRIIMPHGTFMFHLGTLAPEGTYKQVVTEIDFGKSTVDQMLEIYANRMKTTVGGKASRWAKKRIKKWLIDQMNQKEDVYLNAVDAVNWGFADTIFTDWDDVTVYTPEQLAFKKP